MGDRSLLMQLMIILVLTLINGFFAAAEMAMVSANKKKIHLDARAGNKNAKLLITILMEPSRFLSTIQVGITFAGFFSSASAAVGISDDLGKLLTGIGIPFGKNIAFIGVTIILSYIILVFGELVPKRMALQNPEKFAMFAIKPISLFAKLMKPFISLLAITTNGLLTLLGMEGKAIEDQVTLEEIKSILKVGHEQGVLNPIESRMLDSVISFDNKVAEEIMTARTEVFMIDLKKPLEEYVDEMLKLRFSRIPVYEKNPDNIIGVLFLKDYLLEAYKVGFTNIKIRNILKPAYFVPEHKHINDLFLELQANNNHLAILIDEYGGFSGIVTMEDLLEEIVGDIEDEHEHDYPDIRAIDKNTYYANGSLSIKELNSAIGSQIDEDSDYYDTLGGLLIYLLGYIPTSKDKKMISYHNIDFHIKKIADRRIKHVEIITKNPSKS